MSTPVGISALGVHVPRWSLSRAALAEHWAAGGGSGSRSVANWDEDVVTMGVTAAGAALGNGDAAGIDVVIFATASPVFLERQHAAVVAAALGIAAPLCLDVTGTLRAGLDALRLATSLTRSGAARRVLVVAADRRDLPAGSALERLSGDGAAAAVVTDDDPAVEILGEGSVVDPAVGIWRRADDAAVRIGDERFVTTRLLQPWLVEAAGAALGAAGLSPDSVARAVVAAPLPRTDVGVTKQLGIPAGALDPGGAVAGQVGFTGVAAPLLEMAAGLSSAGHGDVVLVAAAGDGASAVVGTVHDAARVSPAGAMLDAALAAARPLPVGMFQRLRGQVPADPVDPYTSEMLLRREQAAMLQLRAPRCRGCGAVAFPPRRVCARCGAKDEMDEVELPRRGTLFTHTVEHLFPVPENRLIMGVVELGPARLYTQVTDTEPDACAPGVPVDLVLRRLHNGGGTPHYFWKAKVRTTGEVGR